MARKKIGNFINNEEGDQKKERGGREGAKHTQRVVRNNDPRG
jgi:hypothetical protein